MTHLCSAANTQRIGLHRQMDSQKLTARSALLKLIAAGLTSPLHSTNRHGSLIYQRHEHDVNDKWVNYQAMTHIFPNTPC